MKLEILQWNAGGLSQPKKLQIQRSSIRSHERPLTPEISRCHDLLRSLFLRGKQIVLQWEPAHCGVWADLLAKKGANLLQQPYTATSFWKIKLFLKNLCKTNSLRDLQTRTALKSWRHVSSSLIPDKPRRDAVATFRLYTGHDCLSAHLYCIGLSTTRFCPLCNSGEKLDRDHLLLCGALHGHTESSRYWEARELLRQ
ncbi:uncharacterized protein [Parasteatoda tepidariorum]|uniref:uncharacterized protein n=1 Tax=Parasteatoda tepidariorum TaxID=114398 RepID=UPI0039BC9C22